MAVGIAGSSRHGQHYLETKNANRYLNKDQALS